MADKQSQEHDKQVLHKMGYAQQLARRMSGFSNFAISFSIICILAGGISAFPGSIQRRWSWRRILDLAAWRLSCHDRCLGHGTDRILLPDSRRFISLEFASWR